MIDECSRLVVIMCFPLFWYFRAIPLIAVLLLSLAPDVYIISLSLTFKSSAILLVDSSSWHLLLTPRL